MALATIQLAASDFERTLKFRQLAANATSGFAASGKLEPRAT